MRSRRLPLEQRHVIMERHKEERKSLKQEIQRSKRANWKSLIELVEQDIWGDGYKIVVKGIKGLAPCVKMTSEKTREVLEDLFPNRSETWETQLEPGIEPQDFTREELQAAIDDLKLKKAPEPDGVPTEILKILWELSPQMILDTYSGLLRRKIFPAAWKKARLVLIPKSSKNYDVSPLVIDRCLIKALRSFVKKSFGKRIGKAKPSLPQTVRLQEREVDDTGNIGSD